MCNMSQLYCVLYWLLHVFLQLHTTFNFTYNIYIVISCHMHLFGYCVIQRVFSLTHWLNQGAAMKGTNLRKKKNKPSEIIWNELNESTGKDWFMQTDETDGCEKISMLLPDWSTPPRLGNISEAVNACLAAQQMLKGKCLDCCNSSHR